MAMYKVRYTVYKDPTGKTIKGATALHFLGDLGSGFSLIGIIGVILAITEDYGVKAIIGGVVMAVVGVVLYVVLHKQAKKIAEARFLKVLAEQEGQTISTEKSN